MGRGFAHYNDARSPAIISVMTRWMRSEPDEAKRFASSLPQIDQALINNIVTAPQGNP